MSSVQDYRYDSVEEAKGFAEYMGYEVAADSEEEATALFAGRSQQRMGTFVLATTVSYRWVRVS